MGYRERKIYGSRPNDRTKRKVTSFEGMDGSSATTIRHEIDIRVAIYLPNEAKTTRETLPFVTGQFAASYYYFFRRHPRCEGAKILRPRFLDFTRFPARVGKEERSWGDEVGEFRRRANHPMVHTSCAQSRV